MEGFDFIPIPFAWSAALLLQDQLVATGESKPIPRPVVDDPHLSASFEQCARFDHFRRRVRFLPLRFDRFRRFNHDGLAISGIY